MGAGEPCGQETVEDQQSLLQGHERFVRAEARVASGEWGSGKAAPRVGKLGILPFADMNLYYFPLLVSKGIYHYWTLFLYFFQGS